MFSLKNQLFSCKEKFGNHCPKCYCKFKFVIIFGVNQFKEKYFLECIKSYHFFLIDGSFPTNFLVILVWKVNMLMISLFFSSIYVLTIILLRLVIVLSWVFCHLFFLWLCSASAQGSNKYSLSKTYRFH